MAGELGVLLAESGPCRLNRQCLVTYKRKDAEERERGDRKGPWTCV